MISIGDFFGKRFKRTTFVVGATNVSILYDQQRFKNHKDLCMHLMVALRKYFIDKVTKRGAFGTCLDAHSLFVKEEMYFF